MKYKCLKVYGKNIQWQAQYCDSFLIAIYNSSNLPPLKGVVGKQWNENSAGGFE